MKPRIAAPTVSEDEDGTSPVFCNSPKGLSADVIVVTIKAEAGEGFVAAETTSALNEDEERGGEEEREGVEEEEEEGGEGGSSPRKKEGFDRLERRRAFSAASLAMEGSIWEPLSIPAKADSDVVVAELC